MSLHDNYPMPADKRFSEEAGSLESGIAHRQTVNPREKTQCKPRFARQSENNGQMNYDNL